MLKAVKWIGLGIAGILYVLAAVFLLFGRGELPWQVYAGMIALPLGLAGRFFFYYLLLPMGGRGAAAFRQ
jgi:hypothetical protein